MKLFITFILGAITGASLLWFGFSKTIVPIDRRLVAVNRFNGSASEVFISSTEAERLRQDEVKRTAAPKPLQVPKRRDMIEAEITKLGFKWDVSHNSIRLCFHNPFNSEVTLDRVRVRIPQRGERAALDREYNTQGHGWPLADSETHLDMKDVPASDLLEAQITPIRVSIYD
jgi:hypothetical protein